MGEMYPGHTMGFKEVPQVNETEKLQEFSSILETTFDIVRGSDKLDYIVNKNNDGMKYNIQVKTIKLKNRVTNDIIILHYIIYSIREFLSRDINRFNIKNFHCPLLLTTNGNITKYGLYENYVYSGNYICKPFDYKEQCSIDENRQFICSGEYTFIGNRYNNLFPFNKIK
jgi:hypothetical protein